MVNISKYQYKKIIILIWRKTKSTKAITFFVLNSIHNFQGFNFTTMYEPHGINCVFKT